MSQRLRALVLAAGLGKRLRPLTYQCPKPLLPVLGEQLVRLTLKRLEAAGCEAAALNLHQLGAEIEAALGRSFGSMRLVYSHEEELLGTLGALVPLRRFLSEADYVFLINGDSLCEWPLVELLRRHIECRPRATLLLTQQADLDEFGGGIGIDQDSRVVSMPGSPQEAMADQRLVFAGAHVFSGEIMKGLEAGYSDIVSDLYGPLLKAGAHLHALSSARSWFDLGTPRRYLEAVCARVPARNRAYISNKAAVDGSSELSGAVIERQASVGYRSRVLNSLLMSESYVGPGASIENVIVGPGARVSEGERVRDAMVTIFAGERCLTERSVVVGRMVHTPLDSS